MIYWELCKKLKFDNTTKWYMHKLEFIQENEMHKFFWNFEIQTDHKIPARRPDLMIINKKKRTRHLVDFAIPMNHRVKTKKAGRELARELRKFSNRRMIVIPIVVPIVIGKLGMVPEA